jgi:DNA-directed RNA polymerase specialized sigma subunit
MTERLETRRKLRAVTGVQDFQKLLDTCVLTENEKTLLKLHYLDGKNLAYIGDLLGFSESAIKTKHAKCLDKLKDFL